MGTNGNEGEGAVKLLKIDEETSKAAREVGELLGVEGEVSGAEAPRRGEVAAIVTPIHPAALRLAAMIQGSPDVAIMSCALPALDAAPWRAERFAEGAAKLAETVGSVGIIFPIEGAPTEGSLPRVLVDLVDRYTVIDRDGRVVTLKWPEGEEGKGGDA